MPAPTTRFAFSFLGANINPNNISPRPRIPARHPRRRPRHPLLRQRVAANASAQPAFDPAPDDDFFISADDLSRSLPQPPEKQPNLSVAHLRLEASRLERAARHAPAPLPPLSDDDDLRRHQVADEKLSAADLFGIVDASASSTPAPAPAPTPAPPSTFIRTTPRAGRPSVSKRPKETPQPQPPSSPPPSPATAPTRTLLPGDLVSHSRHGIGRFRGLERTSSRARTQSPAQYDSIQPVQEYAVVEYRDGDVYVPLSHLELLRKLSRTEIASVRRLDAVSGASTYPGVTPRRARSSYLARRKTRSKIRKQLVNLHGLYADRTTVDRQPLAVDEVAEKLFAQRCSFTLTKDQCVATNQVLDDMSTKRRPMDRLLCGDVGFGKTEVAIRAAFRVLKAGKQVAVLAPTTILAQQHYETFRDRFAQFYPQYTIACLTRFVPRKAVQLAKQGIEKGELQIGIGTHMMLNDKLTFHNLGLLIIDEEHRFGVNQKEKMRARYRAVDTLFLSATPIPRTLHLALSGLRDASVLRTPPSGRKRVITKVSPCGAGIVREAINREVARKGQVFYVVPRIEGIEASASWIEDLFPTLRVLVAHGSVQDLEKRIWAFAQRQYDVLVCTTIIENGINMPDVNTVIVQDAGRFGLAQLHQLRGRVGRSDIQAYAWLLYNRPNYVQSQTASDRLKALEKYSDLGSGFAIAQKDMEMRGVGTILGVEQHGNTSVGADEYARMLAEELDFARTGTPIPITLPVTDTVEVFLPVASLIPEDYISDFEQKMSAYGSLSSAKTIEALHKVVDGLTSRYGPLPPPTCRHVSLLELKLFSKQLGIRRIVVERQHIVLSWPLEEAAFNRLVKFLPDQQSRARCEQAVADERVVLRGLGVCSGEIQLAKLRVILDAFNDAAAGLKRQGDGDGMESRLVNTLYGLSSGGS